MGIGHLNVSVGASTRDAIANVRSFGNECKSAAASAKEMAAAFQGNTVADFEQRFGDAKWGQKAKVSYDDLKGSVVDLSKETRRYEGISKVLGDKELPLLKQMKQSLSEVKGALAGAAAAGVAFTLGLRFGQKLREIIDNTNSWADAQQNLKAALTGSASVQEEYVDRMSRLQTILDAQGRADSARATAERKEILDIEAETKALQRKLTVLRMGEDLTKLHEGLRRAKEIDNPYMAENARARYEAARQVQAEERRLQGIKDEGEAKKKKAHDEELKRQRELAAAERRRRQQEEKEQKVLADLRKEIAQFSRTDAEKRRMDALAEIQDPLKRTEAGRMLSHLDALDRLKTRREDLLENRDRVDSRAGKNEALDARTVAGWQALRNSVKNEELKRFDRMIEQNDDLIEAVREIRPGEGYDPFG